MTLQEAAHKLAKEFDWCYISGRMHGKKWKWLGPDGYFNPTSVDLNRKAIELAGRLDKTEYLSTGGITFDKDPETKELTLWFGKKRSKKWLVATESYD